MAPTINWATKVITVPQSDLSYISGTLYELDVDAFRLDLKDIEDSEEGAPFDDTHSHNTEVTLSGVTYARTFEIINGYTVTFEDGQYTVRCVGANHNLADVKNANQVSLIIGNTAGLQVVTQGSGVTEQDKLDISAQVWDDFVPAYQAKVWPQNEAGTDDYLMAWFKNGQPIISGVTNAKIRVVKASDGTDLVPEDYATEIADMGAFKYSTNLRMEPDSQYVLVLRATIDGGDRIWYQPYGHI